jgi:hypothetical protein
MPELPPSGLMPMPELSPSGSPTPFVPFLAPAPLAPFFNNSTPKLSGCTHTLSLSLSLSLIYFSFLFELGYGCGELKS